MKTAMSLVSHFCAGFVAGALAFEAARFAYRRARWILRVWREGKRIDALKEVRP